MDTPIFFQVVKIPWTEEPGRLQSMRSRRVGPDWATSLSSIGEGSGNPLQCFCLENPRDGGAWWTAVYGVAQSRTRLKRLSSSSSSNSILFKLSNAHPQVSICVPPPIFQIPPTTQRTVEAHELWARWVTLQDAVLLRWKFSGCVCPSLPQIIPFHHRLPCVPPNKRLHLGHYPINEPSNPSKLAHHWILFFRVSFSKEWQKLAVILSSSFIEINWYI